MLCDGRLGAGEAPGHSAEVPGVEHGDEDPQVVECHKPGIHQRLIFGYCSLIQGLTGGSGFPEDVNKRLAQGLGVL